MTIKNFEQIRASRHYQTYMQEVHVHLASLSKQLQADVLREFNSHIYESLEHSNEETDIADVLQRLGKPSEFLPEWVAQKKLENATQSYDTVRIFWALFSAMRYGSTYAFKYTLFGLLYLFSLAFAFLFFAKIFSPLHTGVFHYPDGSFAFGFSSLPSTAGVRELTGWWFLPICAFTSIFLYVVITVLLKFSIFKPVKIF